MLKYLSKVDTSEVKPVYYANELYMKINNYESLITGFLQTIFSEVKNNESNINGVM